jgi:hypothetical protein
MKANQIGQTPIFGREGLLRLVEVVERLRARARGGEGGSWTTGEDPVMRLGAWRTRITGRASRDDLAVRQPARSRGELRRCGERQEALSALS